MRVRVTVLLCALAGLPALAQTPTPNPTPYATATAGSATSAWNGVPDRFQIDAGYFHSRPGTTLSFESGPGSEVDFEQDLRLPDVDDTFWVEGTWRVAPRHQVKLGYTSVSRTGEGTTLQRSFTWGGETYTAGLNANATTGMKILGGYYRFALVRKERFEIGPSVGIGYLWLTATIKATGTVNLPTLPGLPSVPVNRSLERTGKVSSITGAVGGYVSAWPAKRLIVLADFQYIAVDLDGGEAAVSDWRLAANYYFTPKFGLGFQYKYNHFRQDKGALDAELSGEIGSEGPQAYVTFRF